MMADKNVGALLVMDGEKVMGIFSERDYARKVVLQGRSSKETLVSEIMTSKLFTVHPDQTVEEAMEMMTNKRVRHLPVMEDDRLIGMISIGDVLREVIYVQLAKIRDMEDKILGKS
jgi:CBS domain-containing protein